jgi:hypothetical protein
LSPRNETEGKRRGRGPAHIAVRLKVKATEKQDAQDHDDSNNDYLDQGHGKFLKVTGQEGKNAAKNKPYSRKRLSGLSNSIRRFRSPNDDFNRE